MFIKYEKTYRVRVPQFEIKGKFTLSSKDTQRLLSGRIIIEEKVDGANVGIIRTKKDIGFALQKRGSLVGPSEHAQFNYFVNWAYARMQDIKKAPHNIIIYAELTYAKHHIKYTKLPSYLLVFDIWDKRDKRFLAREEIDILCRHCDFCQVPLIYSGEGVARKDLVDMIPKTSAFADSALEGIVIKNNKKQLRGKVVRPEFTKELDEADTHWMRHPLERNLLAQ